MEQDGTVLFSQQRLDIMRYHHRRQVQLGGQTADEGNDLQLPVDIEIGGRLVEHQDRGLLSHGAGNQDLLLFAAGQAVEGLPALVSQPYSLEPLVHDRVIAAVQACQQRLDTAASHRGDFADGKRQVAVVFGGLRDIADMPAEIAFAPGIQGRQAGRAEMHMACVGGQQTAQDFHQGSLAGAIGADNMHELAGGDLQPRDIENRAG